MDYHRYVLSVIQVQKEDIKFRLGPRGWEPRSVSTEWCAQGALLRIWQNGDDINIYPLVS